MTTKKTTEYQLTPKGEQIAAREAAAAAPLKGSPHEVLGKFTEVERALLIQARAQTQLLFVIAQAITQGSNTQPAVEANYEAYRQTRALAPDVAQLLELQTNVPPLPSRYLDPES